MAGKGQFVKGDKRAGRPKGRKNKLTIEVEEAQRILRDRIIANLTPITIAAVQSAIGERFIYRITKDKNGRSGKPEIVTDGDEIAEVLEEIGDAEEGSSTVIDDSYYYISVKPANTIAIKELFDRAFGKAKETIDLNANVVFSLSELSKAAQSRKSGKTKP